MNKEKQRIKIAEVCGYTHVRIIKAIEGPPDIGIGHHPTEPHSVPDYLNDLNAMHEAEKVLSRGQLHRYMLNMQEVKGIGGNNHWLNFHATAAQRAEAFLKTLNLWEE